MIDNITRKLSKEEMFPRRTFGQLILVGALALLTERITRDLWQPAVVHLGIDLLKNQYVTQTVLKDSSVLLKTLAKKDRRVEGSPIIRSNPTYAPLISIVGRVLEERANKNKPIKFDFFDGYKEAEFFTEKISRLLQANPDYRNRDQIEKGFFLEKDYILGYRPDVFLEILNDPDHPVFSDDIISLWEASNNSYDSFVDLIIPGSGLANKIRKEFKLNTQDMISKIFQKEHSEDVKKYVITWIKKIKNHIEKKVNKNDGHPISAGEIFSFNLEANGGDINSSLIDTMLFLKFMARQGEDFHDIRQDLDRSRINCKWYANNILDEYGKLGNYRELTEIDHPYVGYMTNYSRTDRDLSMINQIGKAYHAWNIMMLLMAFPISIIQAGVLYRQYQVFSGQGPVKTAAIFEGALELPKLLELLTKFRSV